MSSAVISQFDWVKELEQTVVKSLTTTFGLDFLLLEDKKGGDVDTLHKAREYQKELENEGKLIFILVTIYRVRLLITLNTIQENIIPIKIMLKITLKYQNLIKKELLMMDIQENTFLLMWRLIKII